MAGNCDRWRHFINVQSGSPETRPSKNRRWPGCQCGGQFLFQFATDTLQFCQRDRIPRHAGKFIFKSRRHIRVARKQNFMHGTIVAGEIADEALDDLRCKSAPLEKTVNIKQVTRMLAIHRGDKFAAVKFRRGQHRHGQLGGKKFPRCVAKLPWFPPAERFREKRDSLQPLPGCVHAG